MGSPIPRRSFEERLKPLREGMTAERFRQLVGDVANIEEICREIEALQPDEKNVFLSSPHRAITMRNSNEAR